MDPREIEITLKADFINLIVNWPDINYTIRILKPSMLKKNLLKLLRNLHVYWHPEYWEIENWIQIEIQSCSN